MIRVITPATVPDILDGKYTYFEVHNRDPEAVRLHPVDYQALIDEHCCFYSGNWDRNPGLEAKIYSLDIRVTDKVKIGFAEIVGQTD